MTDDSRRSRRRVLSLAAGLSAAFAGCSATESGGSTPTDSPSVALFEAAPGDLLLATDELPEGPTWTQGQTTHPDEGIAVSYEVFEDGALAHQMSLSLSRRPTLDGGRFDHDKLVETYREEYDAAVSDLPYGQPSSLVTFGDEAHAIVTYRNVSVNVGFYDDGPLDRLRAVTRLQFQKLDRLAP